MNTITTTTTSARAALAALVPLQHRVAVYVPATVNVAQAVDNGPQVERVARVLSGLFGGATATQAVGYWVSGTGDLVAERTTVVYAYCDESALDAHISAVVALCGDLKRDMAQEAVSLEVDSALYFI